MNECLCFRFTAKTPSCPATTATTPSASRPRPTTPPTARSRRPSPTTRPTTTTTTAATTTTTITTLTPATVTSASAAVDSSPRPRLAPARLVYPNSLTDSPVRRRRCTCRATTGSTTAARWRTPPASVVSGRSTRPQRRGRSTSSRSTWPTGTLTPTWAWWACRATSRWSQSATRCPLRPAVATRLFRISTTCISCCPLPPLHIRRRRCQTLPIWLDEKF